MSKSHQHCIRIQSISLSVDARILSPSTLGGSVSYEYSFEFCLRGNVFWYWIPLRSKPSRASTRAHTERPSQQPMKPQRN
ncbi:hypothetical protein CEXT_466951 [Caerostris extrusa]|uniref:Uncharacterized protein n=1 Tax=Caerostris extrusa TaxID=172846 RepID=A0AAV4U8S2_CAEEX|nr:hypothetical protein CEXT_466951 [Caerostris extrusa]